MSLKIMALLLAAVAIFFVASRYLSSVPAGGDPDNPLRQTLSPMQFRVTQNDGTEPPFRNEYWDHHEAGIYVDVVSGQPVFSSRDKFDSGTGWPSFTQPVATAAVKTRTDRSMFISRTEVRSADSSSHLGHVFEDGPAPTGLRYCINSAALRFIPAGKLNEAGLDRFAGEFEPTAPSGNGSR